MIMNIESLQKTKKDGDDYISREKAVEQIKYFCELREIVCSPDDEFLRGLTNALNTIKSKNLIPSENIQPADRWISVKDRLPEENQKCLVYRNIDAPIQITTGVWHSDTKDFRGLRHGTLLEDAIAWQPLPEPPVNN